MYNLVTQEEPKHPNIPDIVISKYKQIKQQEENFYAQLEQIRYQNPRLYKARKRLKTKQQDKQDAKLHTYLQETQQTTFI